MRKAIFILGGPGSGKGTQTHLLAKKLKLKIIAGGEISRRLAEKNKKIQAIISRGEPISDELIIKEIKKKLAHEKKAGFVFDGVPRRAYQLSEILNLLKKEKVNKIIALHLELPKSFAVKRILMRKFCLHCQFAFRQGEDGYKENVCPNCKSPLQIRSDDTAEAIKKRWQIYKKQNAPILNYFRQQNQLLAIDGRPKPAIIAKNIITKLSERSSSAGKYR